MTTLASANCAIDIPNDAALPGLADSAQPEAMLETCRQRLATVPAVVREAWTRCEPQEAIYQPGRACRISYALIGEANDRAELIYARWSRDRRNHASAQQVCTGAGCFDLFRYPRDRRMREIRSMQREDWLREASREWFAAWRGGGRWADDGWRCTPIKYVPESRLICRLKGLWVQGDDAHWMRAYIRVGRRDDAERQFQFLRSIERSGSAAALGTPLSVPHALGVAARGRLLATEFVRGPTLRDAALAGDAAAIERAAESLAAISRLPADLAATAAPSDLNDPDADTDGHGRSERLSGMLDDLLHAIPEADNAVSRLRTLTADGPPAPRKKSLVHGDLHAGQVILKGQRVCVVDWDSAHLCDATQDIANLAAELAVQQVVRGGAPAGDLASKCVAAWRRGGGPFDTRTLPWWTARAHVLRAWGLLRHLRPGWRHSAGALLDAAISALESGCKEWDCR